MGKTPVENVDKVNNLARGIKSMVKGPVFTGFSGNTKQCAFCGKKVDKR